MVEFSELQNFEAKYSLSMHKPWWFIQTLILFADVTNVIEKRVIIIEIGSKLA